MKMDEFRALASMSDVDSVLKTSLDDAIMILTPQLRDGESAPTAATRLLERLRLDMEDEAGTRKLVRALHRLMPSPPHPTVGEQLLDMFPTLSYPSPVIEELARILVGTTSSGQAHDRTMGLVIERYTNALADDRSLILPVLGSLFDLPLTGQYAASASDLAVEALAIVDEEDVPIVVRTLLRTIDNSTTGSRAIKEVLQQATNLSPHSLALLVDVLNDALILSNLAPSLFLQEFKSNIHRAQRRNAKLNSSSVEEQDCGLTQFGMMVLLILFRHPQHSFEVELIFYALACNEMVPFHLLSNMLEAPQSGSSMLPSLTHLFWWLMLLPCRLIELHSASLPTPAATRIYSQFWYLKPLLKQKRVAHLDMLVSNLFQYCLRNASMMIERCFDLHAALREDLSRCCLSLALLHHSTRKEVSYVGEGLVLEHDTTSCLVEGFCVTVATADVTGQLLARFARIDPLVLTPLSTSILDCMFCIRTSPVEDEEGGREYCMHGSMLLEIGEARMTSLSECMARCSQHCSVILQTILIAVRKNLSFPNPPTRPTDIYGNKSLTLCRGTFILADMLIRLGCLTQGDREALVQWVVDASMRTSEHSGEASEAIAIGLSFLRRHSRPESDRSLTAQRLVDDCLGDTPFLLTSHDSKDFMAVMMSKPLFQANDVMLLRGGDDRLVVNVASLALSVYPTAERRAELSGRATNEVGEGKIWSQLAPYQVLQLILELFHWIKPSVSYASTEKGGWIEQCGLAGMLLPCLPCCCERKGSNGQPLPPSVGDARCCPVNDECLCQQVNNDLFYIHHKAGNSTSSLHSVKCVSLLSAALFTGFNSEFDRFTLEKNLLRVDLPHLARLALTLVLSTCLSTKLVKDAIQRIKESSAVNEGVDGRCDIELVEHCDKLMFMRDSSQLLESVLNRRQEQHTTQLAENKQKFLDKLNRSSSIMSDGIGDIDDGLLDVVDDEEDEGWIDHLSEEDEQGIGIVDVEEEEEERSLIETARLLLNKHAMNSPDESGVNIQADRLDTDISLATVQSILSLSSSDVFTGSISSAQTHSIGSSQKEEEVEEYVLSSSAHLKSLVFSMKRHLVNSSPSASADLSSYLAPAHLCNGLSVLNSKTVQLFILYLSEIFEIISCPKEEDSANAKMQYLHEVMESLYGPLVMSSDRMVDAVKLLRVQPTTSVAPQLPSYVAYSRLLSLHYLILRFITNTASCSVPFNHFVYAQHSTNEEEQNARTKNSYALLRCPLLVQEINQADTDAIKDSYMPVYWKLLCAQLNKLEDLSQSIQVITLLSHLSSVSNRERGLVEVANLCLATALYPVTCPHTRLLSDKHRIKQLMNGLLEGSTVASPDVMDTSVTAYFRALAELPKQFLCVIPVSLYELMQEAHPSSKRKSIDYHPAFCGTPSGGHKQGHRSSKTTQLTQQVLSSLAQLCAPYPTINQKKPILEHMSSVEKSFALCHLLVQKWCCTAEAHRVGAILPLIHVFRHQIIQLPTLKDTPTNGNHRKKNKNSQSEEEKSKGSQWEEEMWSDVEGHIPPLGWFDSELYPTFINLVFAMSKTAFITSKPSSHRPACLLNHTDVADMSGGPYKPMHDSACLVGWLLYAISELIDYQSSHTPTQQFRSSSAVNQGRHGSRSRKLMGSDEDEEDDEEYVDDDDDEEEDEYLLARKTSPKKLKRLSSCSRRDGLPTQYSLNKLTAHALQLITFLLSAIELQISKAVQWRNGLKKQPPSCSDNDELQGIEVDHCDVSLLRPLLIRYMQLVTQCRSTFQKLMQAEGTGQGKGIKLDAAVHKKMPRFEYLCNKLEVSIEKCCSVHGLVAVTDPAVLPDINWEAHILSCFEQAAVHDQEMAKDDRSSFGPRDDHSDEYSDGDEDEDDEAEGSDVPSEEDFNDAMSPVPARRPEKTVQYQHAADGTDSCGPGNRKRPRTGT